MSKNCPKKPLCKTAVSKNKVANNSYFLMRQSGAITVEFAFAMIIAAAILAPVIPAVLDMCSEVMAGVLDRVVPHWP